MRQHSSIASLILSLYSHQWHPGAADFLRSHEWRTVRHGATSQHPSNSLTKFQPEPTLCQSQEYSNNQLYSRSKRLSSRQSKSRQSKSETTNKKQRAPEYETPRCAKKHFKHNDNKKRATTKSLSTAPPSLTRRPRISRKHYNKSKKDKQPERVRSTLRVPRPDASFLSSRPLHV